MIRMKTSEKSKKTLQLHHCDPRKQNVNSTKPNSTISSGGVYFFILLPINLNTRKSQTTGSIIQSFASFYPSPLLTLAISG